VLTLVAVALALGLSAALSVAVFRLLGADDRPVVICTIVLSYGGGPLGRRNVDGARLPSSGCVVFRIREPAEAVLGTHFERGELGFQRSEPCLETGFKGLDCAKCTSVDDDMRTPAGHGWRPIQVLLVIAALVGRSSIQVFLVATSALGRPIERFSIISPVSCPIAAVTGDAVPVGVKGVRVTRCSGVVIEALQRLLGVRVVTEIVAVDEGGAAEAFLDLTRDAVVIAIEAERVGGVSSEGCLGITLVAEVLAGRTLFLSSGIVPKHVWASRSQTHRDRKRNQ
jgi:hypothetical protein